MNKIKLINKLKLRKYRDELNLFIVEGDKLIEEIPKNLIEFIVTVDDIGEREFKKLSELTTPQSAIAVCRKPSFISASADSKLIVVLDRIQEPNNVGAILRTTAAAGIKDVIILEGTADPFSPQCLRRNSSTLNLIWLPHTLRGLIIVSLNCRTMLH